LLLSVFVTVFLVKVEALKMENKVVDKLDVCVVGAGIIGTLTAYTLQKEGHQVTLIDKEQPGNGCSFGNAGMLARSSFVPLANPATVWQAPGWLLNPDGPLCVNWGYLTKIVPWLLGYLKAGFAGDLVEKGEDIHQLTDKSVEMFTAIAEEIGCSDLIVKTDYLQVYRTQKGFTKGEGDMNARRRLGFSIDNLNAEQLHELEPSLSKEYQYAHHLADHAFVHNPHELVTQIYQAFAKLGGVFIEQSVTNIESKDSGNVITTDSQTINCDKLVMAAGAFSARLLKSTGVNIPLETERGYHVSCPTPKVTVNRPVMDGELKFFVTPMSVGYRFAGLVEFAGLDKPPQAKRVDVLTRSAKKMIPQLNTDNATSWMGFRPTLCDSVPVIGYAPNNKHIIYAFGHQHLGLTCAPMTASLVSDLVAQREPAIDVSKYCVSRLL